MIIQCESCETRFRLDDSRIPAQGARVRCSRCKKAFFVANSGASEQEALDEVVAESTDPGGALGPAATQDLFDRGGSDLGNSAVGGDTTLAPDDDDDELWEFEDSEPAPQAAESQVPEPAPAAPPQPAPEPVVADPPQAQTELASATPASLEADPPEPLIDESDSEVGEPGSNAEGLELEGASDAAALHDSATLDPADAELDPTPGSGPGEVEPSPAPTSVIDDDDDFGELGRPEDWDFLAESSEAIAEAATFEEEAAPPISAPQGLAEAPSEPDIFAQRDSEEPVGEPIAAAVVVESAGERQGADPRPWQGPVLAGAGNRIGWLLASALLMFGFVQALAPSQPSGLSVAEPRSFELSLGEARLVRGRFIDNAWSGPIFVVEGFYEPEEVPSGPTTLRLRWLDAEGHPLAGTGEAIAGAALEADQLHELKPEAASALLARHSPDFRFGGRFSVIPDAVPDAATDFELVLDVRPTPLPVADPSADGDAL